MNKKFILAIMVFGVTMSAGFTSVYADTASDKAKIQQVQAQRNSLESKVQMMDNQIEKIMSKINSNENNITNIQEHIKQTEINIAKAEADIKAEQILFDKRMRAMYMNGTSSYIDVILSSNGVEDLISRVEDLKTIITFDQNVISDLETKKVAINLKKVELDTENTKLIALRVDNKKKLDTLTKQKSEQTVLVAQLNAQENKYKAQLATDQAVEARQATQARQAAADKIVNAALSAVNPAPSVTPSRGGAAFSSNSLLAYASNFLGVNYVWGGTSPSGFDCSGFTQYVFAHFGVDIPRVSEDQQNVGTLISRDNLQPGDLVFFGSPAHHVGIYVGNGDMINAPHSGAVIRIQALNNDFTYGRRVN
ncbi:C40 family peptidase [Clostridium tagluense]|uniref:C40 family peptidase n=1 Tax=Clostridium tagluense TaxID=360422 RepID=UPI001CF1B3F7|nr:NlpC/P60 family protein [Clostridium tagluense]MCB2300701.1 NlpC/P60 family protein [Clostridium tagluense]